MTTKQIETLSATARSAVIRAYSDALDTHEKGGSLVTHVCDVARSYLKGEPMQEADRDAISASIVKNRGWKARVAVSRKSEIVAVLKTYAVLPAAVKALVERADSATWHDAISLARQLAKGKTQAQSVAFVKAAKDGKKNAGSTGNPAGRAAGAMSALYDAVKGDKRDAVIKAMRLLTNAGVLKLTGKVAEKFANA